MKENKILKVYSLAILYSMITGLSFVFTKFALDYGDPINILAHRFTIALIGVALVWIARKEKIHLTIEKIIDILPLAIVYPLLFFLFQTFGLKYSDSSEAGILLAIAPIFTLILSEVFLKEKSSNIQRGSVILSVSGVVFIFYMKSKNLGISSSGSMLGTILLLFTALCFAIYSVLARNYNKKYSNIELISVMIGLSAIGFNILALAQNIKTGSFDNYILPFKNIRYIIAVIYLGVLASLMTSILTNYVLSNIEASRMSVFANLATLISIVAGALILNEDIYYYHLIGAALIVIGVIGTNYKKKRIN